MNWKQISDDMNSDGIKNTLVEDGLLVDRDSIIANTIGRTEQDHYDRLIVKLKSKYNKRFFYASKTDDWLFLQVIA